MSATNLRDGGKELIVVLGNCGFTTYLVIIQDMPNWGNLKGLDAGPFTKVSLLVAAPFTLPRRLYII